MIGPDSTGSIAISATRTGTVSEVIETLRKIELAYNQLYALHRDIYFLYELTSEARTYSYPLPILSTIHLSGSIYSNKDLTNTIPLKHNLIVTKVEFSSPGFWTLMGSLNPLLHLREYTNERHERKKDNEYRKSAEKQRLRLENESLALDVTRKKVNLLETIGYSETEIQRIILPSAKALANIADLQDDGRVNEITDSSNEQSNSD